MANYRKNYLCVCEGQQEKMYLDHIARLIKDFPRKVVTFNSYIDKRVHVIIPDIMIRQYYMEGVFIMSRIRQRYDEDFKRNAVKLSYVTSKTMKELAADLGINASLIYNWRRTYTEEGDKTRLAKQEDSLRKLQLENAELKMENEMLKKAAAYFAKHLK